MRRMPRLFLIAFLSSFTMAVLAQQPAKKPATPATASKPSTVAKPASPAKPVLKNALDSMSYAIGMLDGNFFKMQGLNAVNPALLGRGFEDIIKGNSVMTAEQADQLIRRELQKLMRAKVQPNIDAGVKFLANNAKRPEVKQTASGLQYEVLREGNGPKPTESSTVKIDYEGFLINGTRFDGSRGRGEPLTMEVNRFIRGWVEGLQLMPTGSRYKFYIPYQLGYGEQGSGETIPGGSALIFDVELLEIVK